MVIEYRAFRPAWQSSALLAALTALFAWLGMWQLDRAEEKTLLARQFETAPSFGYLPPAHSALRYSRVRMSGRFDPERHVLVDNRVLASRAGVHVLTPFYLDDGRVILVNRGWLPMAADRRSLPLVPAANGVGEVSGMLDHLAGPGRQLGEADRVSTSAWPQLLTYPDSERIAAALEVELYPYNLLLDDESPGGFEGRYWRPAHSGAARHKARALQWFTFAAATVTAWVLLGWRAGRRA